MDIKNKIKSLRKELEDVNNKAFLVREQANTIENQISEVQDKCKHKDLTKTTYDTATCNICGKYFSWYCPNSPTLECDYEQEDGNYDEDCCRYCGEPEERK